MSIATLDRAAGAILSVKARLGLIPGAFTDTAGRWLCINFCMVYACVHVRMYVA